MKQDAGYRTMHGKSVLAAPDRPMRGTRRIARHDSEACPATTLARFVPAPFRGVAGLSRMHHSSE
jgi:hypothetical protein